MPRTMYTASSARRISQGIWFCVSCTAPALPSKLVCVHRDVQRLQACMMASRVGPICAPGARLKDSVVAANWPWWLTSSGARLGS